MNHTTWFISKIDPIKYIFEKPALTGRITRWQMLLSEYDIEYHTLKAIKGNVLADHLAHQPIDDYKSINFEFPDDDVMCLKFDGPEPGSHWGLIFNEAVNAYGNGIEAVVITPHGSHVPFIARLTFKCTNNMSEYEACIIGLEEAIDLRIKNLDVCGDSALVVNQIKGEWETRQPGLIQYKDYARRLSTFFNKIEFHHIPREENQMADALATLASMIIVNRWRPAHVFVMEEVSDDKPWYHNIKLYLQSQEYPPRASNKDKKTLRRLASNFFLNEDVLYKKNFDMVMLDEEVYVTGVVEGVICVEKTEGEKEHKRMCA
ncbi:uncharacterized protein LOC127091879 [Lathyrus oleraceus]|uniref:uncharacterized protein LOC127091879 n=1 Tax=Pisum sativum TaxID=3888 RepID=UPI0021CF46D8|nr:uncharacterized protein LOC127091879 [Pisum sativum]